MMIYLFQLVISHNHVKLPEGNHPKWDRMGMFVNMNQSYSGWYFFGEVFTMILTYEKSMGLPRKNGWNWLDLMGISPIRPLIPGALHLAGTEMPGSHEYDKFLPKAGRKKVAAQGWTRGNGLLELPMCGDKTCTFRKLIGLVPIG
jgi:hypothetical protein